MDEIKRKKIIDYGLKILNEGLTFGAGGNLSIRTEKGMLVTPSAIEYNDLRVEDIIHMDLKGNIISGELKPSSEYGLHTEIYEKREDINAIIHTHSKFISVLASMNQDLLPCYYLIAESGDSSVKVAPYETYGTKKLAETAAEYLGTRKAVILANHGMVACGSTLEEAFSVARDLEFCAFVQVMASITGKMSLIPENKVNELVVKFSNHGQKR